MPSSVYQQTKHKQWSGLQRAPRAAKCFNCGGLSTYEELFKGWCQRCIRAWTASADPGLIAQARRGFAPHACLSVPAVAQLDRVKDRVLEPKRDEDFLPLTQFLGAMGVGQSQALWNVLLTMYTLELHTTSEVFKLGLASHDTMHLCGRHAPVQRTSLMAILSRIKSAGDRFKLLSTNKHMNDYLKGFVSDNRLLVYTLRHSSVDVFERARKQRCYARIGKPKFNRTSPSFWPFAPADANRQHDLLEAIDTTVPKYLPESIRQDVCQDLVVAVLSGHVSLDQLRGSLPKYIRAVFHQHPVKYGPLSLDHPAPWAHNDGRTLGQMIAATEYEPGGGFDDKYSVHETGDGRVVWHEGFDRPRGLSTVGDALRAKNNGVAVDGLALPPEEHMEDEIAQVYTSDVNRHMYGRRVTRGGVRRIG